VNKQTVALLLAAWCALVIAPAWVVVALFTGADADANVTGPIFIIWIVGYLLQLGVFMAAARKASGNSIVGWVLASIVPWIADWSAPVAAWGPAVCGIVVVAYAAWFYSRLARSDDLQHNGIPAVGTVLEVKKPIMNMIINSVYIRRTMTLRIERSDGTPPYEAKYSGTFMLGEIPGPGAVFNLRVDPANPKHFETVDGTTPSASPPPRSASTWLPQNDPTVAEQLQQLDDMHRRGALTDDEFAAAKQRVLRG
jgi:hypothetical protein